MNPLTVEIALEILKTVNKYGPEVAIALVSLFKTGATIDDAILALNAASQKTAQQYKDEAHTANNQTT